MECKAMNSILYGKHLVDAFNWLSWHQFDLFMIDFLPKVIVALKVGVNIYDNQDQGSNQEN